LAHLEVGWKGWKDEMGQDNEKSEIKVNSFSPSMTAFFVYFA